MSSLLFFVYPPLLLCLSEFLSVHHLAVLFPLWGILLLSSSTTLFFFLPYILDIRFFFFLILTPFLQLHLFFYTLYTPLLSSLLSLLLLFSSSMLLSIGHTICFLLVSQEEILVSDFCGSVPLCLCIFHSLHTLPLCYESPKKETVSHAFKHLIQNLKLYNEVKV